MSETPAHVGFIVTPGEIENRIAALDASIQALAGNVARSSAPRLNAPWRREFSAFLRRWAVERDSYASWDSRLFATRVMPRLDDFEKSYRAWARQFEIRSGKAPDVPKPKPSSGLFSNLARDLGIVVAGLGALWILTKK